MKRFEAYGYYFVDPDELDWDNPGPDSKVYLDFPETKEELEKLRDEAENWVYWPVRITSAMTGETDIYRSEECLSQTVADLDLSGQVTSPRLIERIENPNTEPGEAGVYALVLTRYKTDGPVERAFFAQQIEPGKWITPGWTVIPHSAIAHCERIEVPEWF